MTEQRETHDLNALSPRTRRELQDELEEVRDGPQGEDLPTSAEPVRRVGSIRESAVPVGFLFALALVIGTILSLALDSWIFLLLALGTHFIGTLIVLTLAAGLLSQSEHATPELAEDLRADGVANPDRLLTDLADERRRAKNDS